MCAEHNIQITDEQIDILIEAAVKQMKIEEGVTYDADKGESTPSKANDSDKKDTAETKE